MQPFLQIFPFKNGKSVTIDTLDEQNSFFVVAFTSTGQLYSKVVTVNPDEFVVDYTVSLKMGLFSNEMIVEKTN